MKTQVSKAHIYTYKHLITLLYTFIIINNIFFLSKKYHIYSQKNWQIGINSHGKIPVKLLSGKCVMQSQK